MPGEGHFATLLKEFECIEDLLKVAVYRPEIEVLHYAGIGIGRIGRCDSDVQFIASVLVKSPIRVAVDQIPGCYSIRLYDRKFHAIHNLFARFSNLRRRLFHRQAFGCGRGFFQFIY